MANLLIEDQNPGSDESRPIDEYLQSDGDESVELKSDSPRKFGKFYSEDHGREIDLDEYNAFLREQVPRELILKIQQLPFFEKHEIALTFMAEGHDLWDEDSENSNLAAFRAFAKTVILPLASNSQFVELAVKEASICGSTNRGQGPLSALAIVRSLMTKGNMAEDLAEEAESRTLKGNRHTKGGQFKDRQTKAKTKGKRVRVRAKYKAGAILRTLNCIYRGYQAMNTTQRENIARTIKILIHTIRPSCARRKALTNAMKEAFDIYF